VKGDLGELDGWSQPLEQSSRWKDPVERISLQEPSFKYQPSIAIEQADQVLVRSEEIRNSVRNYIDTIRREAEIEEIASPPRFKISSQPTSQMATKQHHPFRESATKPPLSVSVGSLSQSQLQPPTHAPHELSDRLVAEEASSLRALLRRVQAERDSLLGEVEQLRKETAREAGNAASDKSNLQFECDRLKEKLARILQEKGEEERKWLVQCKTLEAKLQMAAGKHEDLEEQIAHLEAVHSRNDSHEASIQYSLREEINKLRASLKEWHVKEAEMVRAKELLQKEMEEKVEEKQAVIRHLQEQCQLLNFENAGLEAKVKERKKEVSTEDLELIRQKVEWEKKCRIAESERDAVKQELKLYLREAEHKVQRMEERRMDVVSMVQGKDEELSALRNLQRGEEKEKKVLNALLDSSREENIQLKTEVNGLKEKLHGFEDLFSTIKTLTPSL